MKKDELISAIAGETGQTKAGVRAVLNALPDILSKGIVENGRTEIPGIAFFQVADRSARSGHNPATGEVIQIPAKKVIKAKASKLEKLAGL